MKKIFLIIAVIAILFLSGCATTTTQSQSTSPYIGGTDGLVVKFQDMGIVSQESDMEEIYTGESFPIEVTLNNKGEEDLGIGDASVTLKGVLLSDFSGIVNGTVSNSELIEKVSDVNTAGGELTLDFTSGVDDAVYLRNMSGSHYDISVFGEVVYHYKTHIAVPRVCFKEDLQDKTICEVDEIKDVFSSGAPISVDKATEKRAGTGKIAIEFEVKNNHVNTGEVTKPNDAFNSHYEQLAFYPNEDTFVCKSGGKVNEGRFDEDGKITIVCTLKDAMPTDTLYEKELDLTLDYKYRELIQHQLRINKQ